MNTALLRYFIGEQEKEKSMIEIVCNTPPERDPFLDLQIYLLLNRIKFVNEVPYSVGLFCSKNEEGGFIVVNNSYTPDWDIPDEKPPIMSTYFYTLKWLKIPKPYDDKRDDKEYATDSLPLDKPELIRA
jgi:hypothetical protein